MKQFKKMLGRHVIHRPMGTRELQSHARAMLKVNETENASATAAFLGVDISGQAMPLWVSVGNTQNGFRLSHEVIKKSVSKT
jgi:hypothetical protein